MTRVAQHYHQLYLIGYSQLQSLVPHIVPIIHVALIDHRHQDPSGHRSEVDTFRSEVHISNRDMT